MLLQIEMSYLTEHIAKTLKEARENKGLSQRALSKKTGVPQSHISKIESGAVDLRLSSLIELARVLDMELALVPRKAVPAVQSIVRSSAPRYVPGINPANHGLKELHRIRGALATFSKAQQATSEFAQLQRRLKDIQHFPIDNPALKLFGEARKMLEAMEGNTERLDVVRELNSKFGAMRNALAHSASNLPKTEFVRPAYSLDDEEEDDA